MQQQNVNMMSQAAVSIAENTSSAKAVFYLSNHRGDTQLCLDGYGDVIAKYPYDAFGNVSKYTGTFTPRYTFSTKEYLPTPANGGMYLYAYRVYDPQAGRWTQRDPIDYQDSINLYQFCQNNPHNNVDPNGQFVVISFILIKSIITRYNKAKAIAAEELSRNRGHNDISDARRHVNWSKRMAEEMDSLTSLGVGWGHEIEGFFSKPKSMSADQYCKESRMDLHNNQEGRHAASEKRDVKDEKLVTTPDNPDNIKSDYVKPKEEK